MMHQVNHKFKLASMEVLKRSLRLAVVGMRYNIFSFLKAEVLWDFMVADGIPI
jgi:hypothetical protein